MPKVDDKYDIPRLSTYLQKIKKNYPDKTDAVVLMEPELEYEYLVQVMDAVRSAEKYPESKTLIDLEIKPNVRPEKIVLFTNISVGDAP